MNNRYEAVAGPNTKQLWVYDNELDIYIDPPSEVLDYIDERWESIDQAEELLLTIVKDEMEKPNGGWLGDKDYYWDGEI